MSDKRFFQSSNLAIPSAELEQWRKLAFQMQPDARSLGPGSGAIDPKSVNNDAQWIRKFNLTVYKPGSATQTGLTGGAEPGLTVTGKTAQSGIDLSNLRCTFNITKTTNAMPNVLYARIYNMSPQTMAKVIEFTRVQVSAGYMYSNYGVIFDGKVVQYRRGKENPVDTYLEIHAGDGDGAYNGATVFEVYKAGTSERKMLEDALEAKKKEEDNFEVAFLEKDFANKTLPRTQVQARKAAQIEADLARAYQVNNFMENGQYIALKKSGYREGVKVILTPKTGLVGMPEVTPQGIQARCLLNSKLRLAGIVQIDSNLISGVPYTPGTAAQVVKDAQGNDVIQPGTPTGGIVRDQALRGQQIETAWTSPRGEYKILLMKYSGDTRGNPWYCDLTCVAIGSNGKVMLAGNPSSAWNRSAPEARTGPGSF